MTGNLSDPQIHLCVAICVLFFLSSSLFSRSGETRTVHLRDPAKHTTPWACNWVIKTDARNVNRF